MSKLKRFGIPFAVLGICVIALVLLFELRPAPSVQIVQTNGTPVQVVTLNTNAFAPSFQLFGTLESPQEAKLEVAKTAYVKATPKLEGSLVNRGDVIVEMDDRDAQLLVRQREGELEDLQAKIESETTQFSADQAALVHEKRLLELAKNSAGREQHLLDRGVGAQSRLEEAFQSVRQAELTITQRERSINDHKNRLRSLEAQIVKAKANLDQAKLDLERSQIRAPFEGRITALNVAVGDRLEDGEVVVELFDVGHVEVRAQVPTRYIDTTRALLVDRKDITAWADINGQRFELKLDRLAGEIGKGRAGVDGLFRVLGDTRELSLGRTVPVTVQLPKIEGVFAIPVKSLFGSNRVYRVEGDTLKLITVERIGQYVSETDETFYLVKSNVLKKGDRLITTQIPNVVNGMKVNVLN